MINSKLHNPIIAKNSELGNVVVEKLSTTNELLISDLGNVSPIIPETGRIWYNSEAGTFKFANIGLNGNSENYVDEFLSRTDLRQQSILSKVDFKDSINILNTDTTIQFAVDSLNKTIAIDNSVSVSINTETTTIASTIINTLGTSIELLVSDTIKVNDGTTDKIVIDNTNNSMTVSYATNTNNVTTQTFNISDNLLITDTTNIKIKADNVANELTINYTDTNITGDVSVDGNMIVTGDLTVGGQTTKVDIASENLTIADNVITLNSNLTTEDPRLASAIVDGIDVDNNAGIDVNRGSEGILSLVQWIESTDTTTTETLKEATANVSIWNYEAAVPAYELHQIIDSYTLSRETTDKSGTSWVGYDGFNGINYENAITSGSTSNEALEFAFKIDAGQLDTTIDTIVQKIDSDNYDSFNTVRVGETPSAGTSFTITHNLGTVFVDVKIQREDGTKWLFDILPIEVIDQNTILIESTESTKIRYMISAIQGFDINQSTDLVIV